jgi:Fe-S-cluster-containing dehydrogenase component/DMSO reductase anchor subunit
MGATRTVHLPVIGGVAPPSARDDGGTRGLLARVLDEQRALTAVERFAQRHADADAPLLEPRYRAHLPATPPGPGQQYAFDVDLDACSGCKACVAACHRLNGLDPGETWRQVGTLHGGDSAAPVLKTVTSACHHCVDPACMRGCPVDAYEKDPVTGIVRHLDDQCIGCQYCTLTCPYEVPSYNPSLGIVRKCDMCSGRLAAGEAPACVQACPSGAITITVVDVARAVEDAQADGFLPGAPSPGITVPTTIYRTREALPRNLLPADFHAVRPAARHLPLVVMLVLTQLAAGTLAVSWALTVLRPSWVAPAAPLAAVLALVVAMLALGASTLHLGRPLYAWRAVRAVRRSWLSREIVVFGAFAAVAGLHAVTGGRSPALATAAAAVGVAGVGCSVMLYAVTHRTWWSLHRTLARFAGTAIVLGLATLHLAAAIATGASTDGVVGALALVLAAKLAAELAVLAHLRDHQHGDLWRTALLLVTRLRGLLAARLALAVAGVALAAIATVMITPAPWAAVALAALVAGELAERTLYFTAAAAPRMPGTFA